MKKTLFIFVILIFYTISGFSQSIKLINPEYYFEEYDVDGPIIEQNVQGNYYKGIVYKYKIKKFTVNNLQMYDAITERNVPLINELIANGYDVSLPIFLKDFSDYETSVNVPGNFLCYDMTNFYLNQLVDNEGSVLCSVCPTRAVKTTALQYAKKINDSVIISILSYELKNHEAKKILIEKIIKEKSDSLFNQVQIIKPGIGFGPFEIGKTSFIDVINILGSNFEISEMRYMRYKDYDVGFKRDGVNMLGKITEIYLNNKFKLIGKFKGVTSDGLIELNKSTIADVINNYGKPKHFECGFASYNGIDFIVEGCCNSWKKAVKLNSKIIAINIH